MDSAPVDESAKLRELDANVRDQDDLERELGLQVRDTLPIMMSDLGADCAGRPAAYGTSETDDMVGVVLRWGLRKLELLNG